MKILCFSDLHCHNYEQFSNRLENGMNSRLQDCLDIVTQAKDYCVENKVDLCVFTGDLFHTRHRIDTEVYISAYKAFKDLSEAVNLVILRGNHDEATLDGKVHALVPFSAFCIVVDKPQVIGPKLYAVPHLPADEFKAIIQKCPESDYLFFHQGISEGFVGPYSRMVKSEVSITDLDFDKVRSYVGGDYHKRQWFGPDGRVHYIGSPLQLSFGERDEEKAFTLIDTDAETFETIPTVAPRFFLVEGTDVPTSYRSGFDFIRMVVEKGDLEKAEAFKAAYPSHVQIQVVEDSKLALNRSAVSFSSDHRSLLQSYLEKDQKKSQNLDSAELLDFGMSLLIST